MEAIILTRLHANGSDPSRGPPRLQKPGFKSSRKGTRAGIYPFMKMWKGEPREESIAPSHLRLRMIHRIYFNYLDNEDYHI